MLRRTPTTLIFIVLTLLAFASCTSVAQAKDMRGKLGLGALSSLSGAEGMSLRYWNSRSFGVELLAGVSVLDRDQGTTRVAFAGGVQALYVLREIGRANLNVGLRLTLGYLNEVVAEGALSTPGEPNTNSTVKEVQEDAHFHLATEIPLTLEYHFADAFSVQMSTGVVVSFIPEEGSVLEGGPLLWGGKQDQGTAFGLGSGGLFGSAGFSYYF